MNKLGLSIKSWKNLWFMNTSTNHHYTSLKKHATENLIIKNYAKTFSKIVQESQRLQAKIWRKTHVSYPCKHWMNMYAWLRLKWNRKKLKPQAWAIQIEYWNLYNYQSRYINQISIGFWKVTTRLNITNNKAKITLYYILAAVTSCYWRKTLAFCPNFYYRHFTIFSAKCQLYLIKIYKRK